MPPVGIAEGIGKHSNPRGHRLEPGLALGMAEDVPVVENQRFKRHAYSNVLRDEGSHWRDASGLLAYTQDWKSSFRSLRTAFEA
jgi:hypothetical protein